MRKFTILFVVMVAIFGISCSTGEEYAFLEYVYEIHDASDLAWLAYQSTEGMAEIKNIRFMADIDLDNNPFIGIPYFSGVMDGNGKKIKNLNIVAKPRVKG